MSREGLTTKQRMFVEAYLSNGFNATEAARTAGYKGNDVTLAAVGYENLRKPQISEAVAERVNEAAMPAIEVLARITRIGRGEVADFIDEEGNFDLKRARKLEKTGLLKKLKIKRDPTKGEEVEFELYSAHEALRDLGKYHKLFSERTEVTGPNGGPIQKRVVYEVISGGNAEDNQGQDESGV